MRSCVAICFFMGALPGTLGAQEHSPWFGGAGVGVHQDRKGNDNLLQDGLFLQVHGGRLVSRALAVRLDLMRASVQRNEAVVFAPCDLPPGVCPSTFPGANASGRYRGRAGGRVARSPHSAGRHRGTNWELVNIASTGHA